MKNNIEKKTSGFGIASLTLGIISIVMCWTFIPSILCGILALIFGIVSLALKSKPAMPVTGIILSIIGLILSILMIIFVFKVGGKVVKETVDYIKENYEEYSEDLISGQTWQEQNGSLLILSNNGSFKYYKNKEDITNYYYEGKYEVYKGQRAIQYIASNLSEYGLTAIEQMNIISRNNNYTINDYYCLILNNETCIIDGENTLTSTVVTPYYGFYSKEDNVLNIINMNSATYYNFSKINSII